MNIFIHGRQKAKPIALILAIMMCFTICFTMFPVAASSSQVLTASDGSGRPGQQVQINFTLNDGVGLSGMEFEVHYDANQFEINSTDADYSGLPDSIITPTGLNLGAPTVGIYNASGYASFVMARPGGTAIPAEAAGTEVSVLGIKFTVKANAINGEYPIAIRELTASASGGTEPMGTPVNGSITITGGNAVSAVAAPGAVPAAGAVDSGTEISLSSATTGATIYYTLDGSTPTSASTPYNRPITITAATTIKAIAVKSGMTDSSVTSYSYTLNIPTVATPVAAPAAGEVVAGTEVALSSATTGATIYYTLDGSTPTSASTPYSGPITITAAKTIKAIAVKDEMANSAIMSAAFTILSDISVKVPSFNDVYVNYSQPAAKNIILTNNTNRPMDIVGVAVYMPITSSATVSGEVYNKFILNKTEGISLVAKGTDTSYTLQPVTGLAVGTHTSNLVVAFGEDGETVQAEVFFNVRKKSSGSTSSGGGGGGSSSGGDSSATTSTSSTSPSDVNVNLSSSSEEIWQEVSRVTSLEQAKTVIQQIVANTPTNVDKDDAELVNKVTDIVQQTMNNLSASRVKVEEGNILNLSGSTISSSRSRVTDNKAEMESILAENGFELNRNLSAELNLVASFDPALTGTIKIDSSVANALSGIAVINIVSENYGVSFRSSDLIQELGGSGQLEVSIAPSSTEDGRTAAVGDFTEVWRDLQAAAQRTSYTVSFNKANLKAKAKVALVAPRVSDTQYLAVIKVDGADRQVVGGKYNELTGKVDVPLSKSGTYVVQENRVDFSDIAAKDQTTNEAIKVLAAKGIITGTGGGQYSPDVLLSRADMAALIVKTLYSNTQGQAFSDIPEGAWYKSYAEIARAEGIISGYPGNIFGGNNTLTKEQLIAISARTLRDQKNYRNPADVEKYLSAYVDRSQISAWATTDVSLATREGLVVTRSDQRFNAGGGITRGEAAVVLKRLFDRL